MPVSPADGEDLAVAIGVLYEDAEAALLTIVAQALAEGIDSPSWARAKLAAVGDVRRAIEAIIRALQADATGAIGQALAVAYARGDQAAVAELGVLPEGRRAFVAHHLPAARAVDRLAAAVVAEQQPVWARILRAPLDAYRAIIGRVSGNVLLGGLTRRQTAQRALDQFAAQGIKGFVDRAGRHWSMTAYAEMAVRSATGRAAIQGHIDRLQDAGLDLVIVSDAPLDCPLCHPWEGRILALSGPPGARTVTMEHMIEDGRQVPVRIAGTLEEARAAGLLHPNCRHSTSAFLPGVTRRPQAPPHPQGATYEDTQQQRYLERQVRAWKRVAAVAMNDTARRKANARVREYQGRIRELTAEKGLRRKPPREQIGSAR